MTEATWGLALEVTLLGMGTVMIVLYVINLMIRLMGRIFSAKKVPEPPAPVNPASVPAVSADGMDDGELIAVITAAISAQMGSSSRLVVRPNATIGGWASAGRSENTQKL